MHSTINEEKKSGWPNAQQNIDLYINLRILYIKGQFSQQMTISEKKKIVEPGVFNVRSENR